MALCRDRTLRALPARAALTAQPAPRREPPSPTGTIVTARCGFETLPQSFREPKRSPRRTGSAPKTIELPAPLMLHCIYCMTGRCHSRLLFTTRRRNAGDEYSIQSEIIVYIHQNY